MPARLYKVGDLTVSKVAVPDGPVHVVAQGLFWKGDKTWEHRALCGQSISGVAVSLSRLTCPNCRTAVERIRSQG